MLCTFFKVDKRNTEEWRNRPVNRAEELEIEEGQAIFKLNLCREFWVIFFFKPLQMDSTKSIEFQDIKTETETSITSLWLKQEHSLLKNFPGINKLLFLIIPWGLPIIPAFTTFIRQNKYYRAISLSKQSTIFKEEAQMSHFTRKWAKPQVLCCFCNQRMYTA